MLLEQTNITNDEFYTRIGFASVIDGSCIDIHACDLSPIVTMEPRGCPAATATHIKQAMDIEPFDASRNKLYGCFFPGMSVVPSSHPGEDRFSFRRIHLKDHARRLSEEVVILSQA